MGWGSEVPGGGFGERRVTGLHPRPALGTGPPSPGWRGGGRSSPHPDARRWGGIRRGPRAGCSALPAPAALAFWEPCVHPTSTGLGGGRSWRGGPGQWLGGAAPSLLSAPRGAAARSAQGTPPRGPAGGGPKAPGGRDGGEGHLDEELDDGLFVLPFNPFSGIDNAIGPVRMAPRTAAAAVSAPPFYMNSAARQPLDCPGV